MVYSPKGEFTLMSLLVMVVRYNPYDFYFFFLTTVLVRLEI